MRYVYLVSYDDGLEVESKSPSAAILDAVFAGLALLHLEQQRKKGYIYGRCEKISKAVLCFEGF